MKILLKDVYPLGFDTVNNQKKNLFIENGILQNEGAFDEGTADKIIVGAKICPGFVDVGTQISNPGYEQRESIKSLGNAANIGGFTTILPFPNTKPSIDNASLVQSVFTNFKPLVQDFYPIGNITKKGIGKEIAEMLDMAENGAIGFSDGNRPLSEIQLMSLALQYSKTKNLKILQFPTEPVLSKNGQMHEGITSTQLGLKAIPNLAEEIIVQRDIKLAAYHEAAIHFHAISTKESVQLIREAQQNNIRVTASVAAMNLVWNDTKCDSFDVNFKVLPPLRDESDRLALIEGLKDGTISHIVSGHTPLDAEEKNIAFVDAEFGSATLEVAIALSWSALKEEFTLEDFVKLWSTNIYKQYQIEHPSLHVGKPVNLSILDEKEWIFDPTKRKSKGVNPPSIDFSLELKVKGIILREQYYFNH